MSFYQPRHRAPSNLPTDEQFFAAQEEAKAAEEAYRAELEDDER